MARPAAAVRLAQAMVLNRDAVRERQGSSILTGSAGGLRNQMSDSQPNLTLGDPPGRLANGAVPAGRGWLKLSLLLQAVVIVGLAVLLLERRSDDAPSGGTAVDELRAAAIQLEDRDLNRQAAIAWQRYLDTHPAPDDRPQILFRIGELYMKAELFEDAAAAFIRAEEAAGGDSQLSEKVGRRIVTCLRRLGKYGEVGRELTRRVEVGSDEGEQNPVLATFAGEQFTQADLDRLIERRVDQMLTLQPGARDEQQRAALLRQLSAPEGRRRILQEMLQSELFSRRARELGLDANDEFLQVRDLLEQNLLSTRFLQSELERIAPTNVDIESFFKAHQDRYRQPESAQVRILSVNTEEEAAEFAKISSPQEFRKHIANRDPDGTGVVPATIVRRRHHPQLGDVDALLALNVDEWTPEPIENNGRRFMVLVEAKTPSRVSDLDEVRLRVESDYRTRKTQELTQKLFQDVMTRYDVIIYAPPSSSNDATGNGSDANDSGPGGDSAQEDGQ